MSIVKNLRSTPSYGTFADLGLLLLRIGAGGFMITHGWGKLLKLVEGDMTFADPIGVGPELSLILTVFAEVFCALLILVGLLTRFAAIPFAITMFTAVFIIHANDEFAKQEMGLMYLIMSLAILLMGAGRYSLDYMLKK